MKSFILIVFMGILFISCNKYQGASANSHGKTLFQNHINTVINYEEGKKKVLVDNYREAINFLSLVTGINSMADYSSTFGYSSQADYKNDILLWKEWYKKNKYKLTDQYIDSSFKSVGLTMNKN